MLIVVCYVLNDCKILRCFVVIWYLSRNNLNFVVKSIEEFKVVNVVLKK